MIRDVAHRNRIFGAYVVLGDGEALPKVQHEGTTSRTVFDRPWDTLTPVDAQAN